MLPKRLEMRNFLAYRQPDPIVFDGVHLACLTGPNGAGKSSLLDAITWALWGRARLRLDDDLIYQGQTEMFVQLDFEQGADTYRVIRKRQRSKTGRTGRSALDLFIWDEGQQQWQAITAPSIRETQERIIDLLRLDYDTFVHSAFLQQGRADAFTVKPPAQRKEILGDILGLGQWAIYEERAKEKLRTIQRNLAVIEMQLADIARQEAEEPALRRDLKLAEEELAEARQRREEAEARYAEVAGAEEQMNAAKTRLAQAEHRIRQREDDLREITAELERTRQRAADLKAILAERESIQAGYARLQEAREADQALGEKLQALSALKDRLNTLDKAIQERRAELESEIKVRRDRIANAEQSAAERDDLQADLSDVRGEIARLVAEEERRDALRDQIAALNEEAAALEAENKALYKEMQALRERIDRLQEAEATCPLCGQPLEGDHKEELLAELTAEGTQRGDAYRANQARREEIRDEIAQANEVLKAIDAELVRLQPLRDTESRLQTRLEAAHSAADTIQTEEAELKTLEATLASGDFAQELRSQRDSVQAEIDALGYDSEAHTAARDTLNTYSDYERRQRDLETAEAQLPQVEQDLQQAEARRERWEKALAEERAEADAARADIDNLQEQVEEARRREQELRESRKTETRANENLIRAEQKLKALEAARERKVELEKQRTQQTTEQAIFEELRDAFGKNGVPAMIIEAAIPELEETANDLLARMTAGRMHVRLDTQREKKGGGVRETLDILISDELGTRSYEAYSGGEAFRVNFAIRVALSQMLARRAGAQLRTLFIDEGFGTQDEEGRQRLIEAITSVEDKFDLLLVITHIDELRDAFPVQIAVAKTPDGSRITMN